MAEHKLELSSNKVLVKGTIGIDADRLQLFFKNKQRGGGKNAVKKELHDSQAVVIFQKSTGRKCLYESVRYCNI